jgi:hypothetical protein
MTAQEEKIRVNARVPKNLYDWVCSEYDNVSQAINEGLESLRNSKTSILSYSQEDNIPSSHTIDEHVIPDVIPKPQIVIHNDIQTLKTITEEQKTRIDDYKIQIKTLFDEIERLRVSLNNSPDPSELAQLRGKYGELEKHNLTLREELEKAHQDKDDIKNLYDNYMRQMQTLIQQKAIEAPGEKKKWWKFW